MTDQHIQFPHCDSGVLHAPGECEFCDRHPDWQNLRNHWGIAFTGHQPGPREMSCPSDFQRGLHGAHGWYGNQPTNTEVPVEETAASKVMYPVELRHPRDEYDQPLPTPNDGAHIHDLLTADIQARKELGTRRYGTPLQAHNGRDALLDAYQECLDLAVYLRQLLAERPD